MQCRFCGHQILIRLYLGLSPLSNSYVLSENENLGETFHPLHVRWCPKCFWFNYPQLKNPKIFSQYMIIFRPIQNHGSNTAKNTEMMLDRLKLDQHSLVIELASNDGYLLQYFEQRGIPVLGIEPAKQN